MQNAVFWFVCCELLGSLKVSPGKLERFSYDCYKEGYRHKVHHYEERVIFLIGHFSNWSTLHRNALAARAACLDPHLPLSALGSFSERKGRKGHYLYSFKHVTSLFI